MTQPLSRFVEPRLDVQAIVSKQRRLRQTEGPHTQTLRLAAMLEAIAEGLEAPWSYQGEAHLEAAIDPFLRHEEVRVDL